MLFDLDLTESEVDEIVFIEHKALFVLSRPERKMTDTIKDACDKLD